MDEELKKYIAEARAMKVPDEKIAATLKEKYGISWEPPPAPETGLGGYTGLSNLGRSMVQGASFNFGDDLVGMLPEWMGGGSKAKAEYRRRDEAFRKAHPVAAGAAEIGGGFVVPGGIAGEALGGAMNVKRAIGAGALLGGASGALAGAGAAEGGLEERAAGAARGAVPGAVVGAVIPGALATGKALFSPASRAAARLRGAVGRSGGPQAVIASAEAADELGRGAEQILGDQSKPLQQATDFAANNSEQAFEALERPMAGRAQDVNQRVLNDVTARTGNPDADQIADQLRDARLTWAESDEGFGGLRRSNPAVLPMMGERFQKLMAQDHVREALDQARDVGLIGDASLGIPKDGGSSFAVLQGAKERLDAMVGGAFGRPGLRDLGVKLKQIRGELIGLMREGVPGYGKVADQYGKMMDVETALQHGQASYTQPDSRGLKDLFSSYSADEKRAFRQGLVSELIVDLRRQATGQAAANRMVRMSPRHKDVMEIAFGSKMELQRFMAEMEIERQMSKTGEALAGSQTHRRGAATADPAAIAVDAATQGPVGAAVGAGRSMLPKWLAGATAREMGPTLATQGTPNITELMRRMQRSPQDLLGEIAARRAPIAAGLFGEEMFGDR